MINLRGRCDPPTHKHNRTMIDFFEKTAVNPDSTTLGNSSDNEKRHADQEMLQFTEDMIVVVPSNNDERVYRFGYLEILDEANNKVEVNTLDMTPDDLDDLTWEIEKAADEGRLRIHEIVLTEEEAKRLGISFCYTGERVALRHGIQIPSNHRFGPIAINESLRPASRPNKKNKGKTYYNQF